MSHDADPAGQDQNPRKTAEEIVGSRIRAARKEEILILYDDLLRTIWSRLVPTLGRVTVIAMLERALAETSVHYPFMAGVEFRSDGMATEILKPQLDELDSEQLRAAMKELVANLVDLLAVLTGDIIVKRLLAEIQPNRPEGATDAR